MTDIYTSKSRFKSRVFLGLSILCIAGLVGTLTILYLTMQQDIGPTYAIGIKMLASVRHDIFLRTAIVFGVTFFFAAAGILTLSMLYSHRIAGPLYHLTQFTKKVTAGDLRKRVTLREKDVVHPVAEELNEMVAMYQEKLLTITEEVENLRQLGATSDGSDNTFRRIKSKAGDIYQLTEQFQL